MSLVAVVTRPSDRPDEPPQTQVVPVGMPQDAVFGAYFQSRSIFQGVPTMAGPGPSIKPAGAMDFRARLGFKSDAAKPAGALGRFLAKRFKQEGSAPQYQRGHRSGAISGDVARPAETTEDVLLDLASSLNSDGGMPGKDLESRAVATCIALLAFLSQGHTTTQGAFRSHVGRLMSFLKSLTGLSSRYQKIVTNVVDLASRGTSPPLGEWMVLARTPGNHWEEVETSVLNVH
jgi:hypothetical protein